MPESSLEKARSARARLISNPTFGVIAFLLVHIPLAVFMRQMSSVATLHAVATAILGLWWAMRGRQLERVAYMAAYIAGSEVLWRMSSASVFWEFAKYSTAAMFLIALLRLGRCRRSTMAFIYFSLLLPSVAQTLIGLDPGQARRQLSFNLSGPLMLMMGVCFFSNLEISKAQLHRLFLMFMGPLTGVVGVAAFRTLGSTIQFNGQSNAQMSAGFGPNQVSAVLGLGAFLAFFYLLHDRTTPGLKAVLIVLLMTFATQSAMTFSRGGLYAAAGSALMAGLFLVREKRGTARLLQVAPVLFLAVVYVVVPQLVAFTGGAITERFHKTNLTRRGDLMQADLRIWRENPIFGVGPGMGAELRGNYGEHMAAHTEFTRLLSEHGLFGAAALLVLLGIGTRAFLRARGPGGKALSISLMIWSFLYMSANGMRLVAPSFTFGLACVTVLSEKRVVRRVRRPAQALNRGTGAEGKEPWRDPDLALPAL